MGRTGSDARAISLCRQHHRDLHDLRGDWRGWTREMVRTWMDEQIEAQRSRYLAMVAGLESAAQAR